MYVLCILVLLTSMSTCLLTEAISNDYILSASKDYVRLAAVAFCDKKCVQSWSCGTGKPLDIVNVAYIEHPTTKAAGFVGYFPLRNQIVLSYRGSNNIQNWIQDVNFEKIPYLRCLNCEIHAGFYADYRLLQNFVNGHVEKLVSKYPTASILTTGHSLGAAISAICALELKMRYPTKIVEIHNFGQPRLGNVHLAKFMHEKLNSIFRVVHHKDIVPHLPPDLPEFQYHHPSTEIFFNADNTVYKICDSTGEDKSCSNQYFPEYNPNDHDFYFIYISQTKC